MRVLTSSALALCIASALLGCEGPPKRPVAPGDHGEGEPVTLATYVRAETDLAIRNAYRDAGFSRFLHFRTPPPLDQQRVTQINRDTVYSVAIVDLSRPATVVLPEAAGRYMSLHVIDQDHYSFAVAAPGRHELTRDDVGTPYAYLIVRTFADADDPLDLAAANALQDRLAIEGGGSGPLALPDWNTAQLGAVRAALTALAIWGAGDDQAFGTETETDPIEHLVHTATAWGGLPDGNAHYELGAVAQNDGTPHAVTVKDVPVDAFWSLTVYGADGYIELNERGAYSVNSVDAVRNADGSITIHFGACDDGRANCLPISKGWSYAVRMYEPRPEALDGRWTFPSIEPVR